MNQLVRDVMWDKLPFRSSVFKSLFLLGLFVSTPSLALYVLCRAWGALPSETDWSGNHGPWRSELQGAVLWLGLICSLPLPFISFLCAIGVSLHKCSVKFLLEGIALTTFQVACFYGLTRILWAAD
jgi:hypothetical protein